MSGPLLGLPLSALPSKLKNKRVLLLDASATKRDLRAESMRKLGMEVDCAADVSEARSWWRADLYSLVLIDTESELGRRDRFCDDMRRATPPQQISFLVGKPGYLADAPQRGPSTAGCRRVKIRLAWGDVKTALAAELARGSVATLGDSGSFAANFGGAVAVARALASDAGPAGGATRSGNQGVEAGRGGIQDFGPRTSETRTSETRTSETRTLDDLLREELQ